MVLDNFNLLERYMKFSEDRSIFYFIQIIKRRKDAGNESMSKGERMIKSYFIDRPLSEELKTEIKTIATAFNARVYLSISPCIKEKVVKLFASKAFSNVLNRNYDNFVDLINNAAGDPIAAQEKLFLVDIDTKDNEYVESVAKIINGLSPASDTNKIVLKVPTFNGMHLICKPFHLEKFKNAFPNIDVHKNNATLLYAYNSHI